jgi:hypothetical protein
MKLILTKSILTKVSYVFNLIIFLIVLWLYALPKNEIEQINIGDTYLFSFQWDKENPFEKVKIDTVKVLDIKNDYVQYQYAWANSPSSTKLRIFKECIKPIKK